jgi:hypothetical protein
MTAKVDRDHPKPLSPTLLGKLLEPLTMTGSAMDANNRRRFPPRPTRIRVSAQRNTKPTTPTAATRLMREGTLANAGARPCSVGRRGIVSRRVDDVLMTTA